MTRGHRGSLLLRCRTFSGPFSKPAYPGAPQPLHQPVEGRPRGHHLHRVHPGRGQQLLDPPPEAAPCRWTIDRGQRVVAGQVHLLAGEEVHLASYDTLTAVDCPPARCRLRRRVEQLLATAGVDPVEVMPSRATFYRLVERLGSAGISRLGEGT